MKTTMPRAAAERRLRGDLATARRARGMINDPLSMRMLSDYISELEDQLFSGALPVAVPDAPRLTG
ncbi:MAG: hypothetical protein PGN16_14500 [Sphingomonas phyllosphaerae]|uniref:hypothetical protein n=1 Tax=Sphingomonas phyllosphaerae TaxID=257003 RepID=UPI002FFA385A